MNRQTIAELAKLLAFLPPRPEIMAEAMAEDAKRARDDEASRLQDARAAELRRVVAIRPSDCYLYAYPLKNAHRPREDWRGKGKRRARFPK